MYYIFNTELNKFYSTPRFGNHWTDKPRVFASKGGLKQSLHNDLRIAAWHRLSNEQKERYIEIAKLEYTRWEQDDRMIRYWAQTIHWRAVSNKPLEELLPPHLELRTIIL